MQFSFYMLLLWRKGLAILRRTLQAKAPSVMCGGELVVQFTKLKAYDVDLMLVTLK